jgi:non-ribosomal peptide synthetase component F
MIVAILGILKAGGAYVPLDLLAPPERLAFMLRNTKIDVVLTQARMQNRLPALDALVIRLDADWGAIAARPQTRLEGSVSADDLAHVTYTSGSTGEPKGVAVTHRNVVRLVKRATRVSAVTKSFCSSPRSRSTSRRSRSGARCSTAVASSWLRPASRVSRSCATS